jgi:sugar phosphate isomerase/epimerase
MIRLGMCGPADKAKAIAAIGYDYIEMNLTNLSLMPKEQYEEAKTQIEESGIKAEAFNVMIPGKPPRQNCGFGGDPGKFRLTGDDADLTPVREYLEDVIPKAAALGCRVIVFGSGAARRMPDGYSYAKAYAQIVDFLRLAREILTPYGIRLAIEPLNHTETNIIHTVADGALFALASREDISQDSPQWDTIGALADTYHMYQEEIEFGGIALAGKLLYHVHTAANVSRLYPKEGDGTGYAGLFRALKEGGYDGRVSVEGGTTDFENDAREALRVLQSARG